jgi:hypothetical protein
LMEAPPQWESRSHGGTKGLTLVMLRKLTGYSNGSFPRDNDNYILVVKSDCYSMGCSFN